MKRTIWRMCVLALPASLFAGTLTLTDGLETVTTNGNQLQIGNLANCAGTCLITGQNTSGPLKINWSFVTANPITDSGSAPNFAISNGTGTFTVTDNQTLGGGDTVTGTLNLTNVVEFSGGGGTNNNMTINGLLTVPSGGLTTGGSFTALFLGILAQGGITPPIPGGGESAGLTINVVNCTKGGVQSACIIQTEPIGTVASVGITSTTSAVPEPTTLALFGAGLAGLFFRKRFTR